jgi:uncharacterized protein (DUF2141 family)
MLKRVFVALFICALFAQCARRGSPVGGPKDETPPVLLRAEPPQKTINFKDDEIRIYFDEYIKLDKLREQLVISPPLDQSTYIISPQGMAAKYITIALMDTLASNTTYTFNFGESVVDNNEGNPLSFFSYVFSTGSVIDSLTLNGRISDALLRKPENFVSVMLYPIDSTFTDSVIFKNKPLYYTNTLDSLVEFNIPNLKEGDYLLAAVKDVSKNYVFDTSIDKIDVISEPITLPNDSLFSLSLFKEEPDFAFGRAYQAGEQRIGFGYTGSPDFEVVLEGALPESFASVVSLDRETDTLYYWYKGIEVDSLKFTLKHDTLTKSYEYRIRKAEPDSLKITVVQSGILDLADTLKIRTNTPLKSFDMEAISLLDKDSVSIPYNLAQNNKHELQVLFDVFPSENYQLQLLPGAITDFFDVTNDTLKVTLKTKSRVDYGNLSLRLGNVPTFPVFIDLLDEKEEIKRSIYVTEPKGLYRFAYLKPNKYYLRVRIDRNANGKWDTGHYLKKQKPEAVYHFESQLDVRANWELQEQFILK